MTEYVRLPRSVLDDELWRDKELWQLYGYLLSKADGNGAVETSLATMQRDLKINQKPLRTMLAKLERANKVAKAGANTGSKITICGYDGCVAKGANKRAKAGANKRASGNTLPVPNAEVVLSPPFVAPEFAEIWSRFVAYRKEIRKPYKSESSERIAYNKMVEMSNNDPAAARDMVERAILGQWQGLFQVNNNGKQPRTTIDNAVAQKAQRDRGLSLATQIVAGSENLLSLYNGGGPDSDTREN